MSTILKIMSFLIIYSYNNSILVFHTTTWVGFIRLYGASHNSRTRGFLNYLVYIGLLLIRVRLKHTEKSLFNNKSIILVINIRT